MFLRAGTSRSQKRDIFTTPLSPVKLWGKEGMMRMDGVEDGDDKEEDGEEGSMRMGMRMTRKRTGKTGG